MSADALDREFAAFVGGRGTALLRTAYLVSGDEALADDLLVEALARTRLDWVRVEGTESAESYALRQIVSGRGPVRAPVRLPSSPAPDPIIAPPRLEPEGPDQPGEPSPDVDHQRIWAAFTQLTQPQRAALVLGIHESLDDEEIARLVGRSARSTRADITQAVAVLRRSVDPSGQRATRPLNERLADALAARAYDVRAEADLTDRALARVGSLRAGRRRTQLKVAAGVAVGLVVLAAALGLTQGDRPPPGALGPSVGSSTPAASAPSSDPQLSVAAIPDAVLQLAQTEHVMLGYGSTIIDGSSGQLSVVIDLDPATGASRGDRIEALARAEGGYVVLTSPPAGSSDGQVWTLSYVPRTGSRVELGRIGMATPGFAVAPDGLSVVHVIAGPVDSENALRADQTALVVQTLGAEVLNRVVVYGPTEPLALDPDKVWFNRPIDPIGPPLVWERVTSAVQRIRLRTGLIAAQVQADLVLVRDESSARCIALLDAHDYRHPAALWRRCAVSLPAAIEPAGGTVAMVTTDGQPGLLVVDADTGAPLGRAAVDAAHAVAMAWTANGQRLLVETREAGRFTVVGVPPPTTDNPVIGEPISYDLGTDEVVLGRELPLPGVDH